MSAALASAAPRSVVGAIDVGTNMVRMRVDAIEEGAGGSRRRTLDAGWEITRLGGGLEPGGPLAEDAMERTLAVLERFAARARAAGAQCMRVVGTSAAREASNGAAFAERVRSRTGLTLEIVDGGSEARLDALGVIADLDGDVRDAVILDIGGGSTEWIEVRGGVVGEAASVPIGVVRLTEALVRHDPPSDAELEALDRAAREALSSVGGGRRAAGCELIANAGTATTLAAVDLQLEALDADRIRGHRVSRPVVDRIHAELAALPAARRLLVPGLVRGREDLIVAGLAILRAAMDRLGAGAVRISTGGLLEGLLVEAEETSC